MSSPAERATLLGIGVRVSVVQQPREPSKGAAIRRYPPETGLSVKRSLRRCGRRRQLLTPISYAQYTDFRAFQHEMAVGDLLPRVGAGFVAETEPIIDR